MPYTYNRASFCSARSASTPVPTLLQAYCAMVCLELFLTDYLPMVGRASLGNHDVPKMLRHLASALPTPTSANVISLSVSLSGQLGALWCEDKGGGPRRVKSTSYPYIRYLRHPADWPDYHSTDAEILSLMSVISQIRHALHQAGIPI